MREILNYEFSSKCAFVFLVLFFALASIGTAWAKSGNATTDWDGLEAADAVIVGEITKIEPLLSKGSGLATIHVSEVLRGNTEDHILLEVSVPIEPAVDSKPSNIAYLAQIVPLHPSYIAKDGDAGIWFINRIKSSDHYKLEYDDLFSVDTKAEFVEMIKRLENRTWSSPVNGLIAWAGQVELRAPEIKLELKNESDADIYLFDGMVKVIAVNAKGESKTILSWDLARDKNKTQDIDLMKLAKGRKMSMPFPKGMDWATQSFILDGKGDLTTGKYKILVTFEYNNPEKSKIGDKTVWQGKLEAPPFELTVESPPAQQFLWGSSNCLDQYSDIVIGEIIKMDPCLPKDNYYVYFETGMATIKVNEVLKGPSKEFIRVPVITGEGHKTNGGPIKPYFPGYGHNFVKINDSGIWFIYPSVKKDPQSYCSRGVDDLPITQKDKVQEAIAQCQNSAWTHEVNGLKATAGFWAGEWFKNIYMGDSLIGLTVENVSNQPVHIFEGKLLITAINEQGKPVRSINWYINKRETIYPGNKSTLKTYTAYIKGVPDMSSYPEFKEILPAGKYKISVSFENEHPIKNKIGDKIVWQGKLEPPAFDMVVGESTGGK